MPFQMKAETKPRIGLGLSALSLAVALLWWLEIGYRYLLFVADCEGQPFVNHVDDAYFPFTNIVLGCFIITGCISGFLLSKHTKLFALAAVLPVIAGGLAWVCVQVMHRNGILIGYVEYISRIKGFSN